VLALEGRRIDRVLARPLPQEGAEGP